MAEVALKTTLQELDASMVEKLKSLFKCRRIYSENRRRLMH